METKIENGVTESSARARNARFWCWVADGWVRLTLRPGQELTWGRFSRDCEGFSAETSTWRHVGQGVEESWLHRGRDCDGYVESGGLLFCPIDRLAAVPAWEDVPDNRHAGKLIGRPDWQKAAPDHCRDEYAEAANF